MRPTPIPDEGVPAGWQRIVMSAPNGDLLDDTIAPLEVIVTDDPEMGRVFVSRWMPDAEDLARLQAGEPLRMVLWSAQVPVCLAVGWDDGFA